VINPVCTTNPNLIIGNALRAVLGVTGAIALFMFVYGGIILLTSRGNDQSVTKGKNILIWATIGIAVIFSSFALVEFVIRGITG